MKNRNIEDRNNGQNIEHHSKVYTIEKSADMTPEELFQEIRDKIQKILRK